MRLVAFKHRERQSLGVVTGDTVVDLPSIDSRVSTDVCDFLSRTNGDLGWIRDAAANGPAAAHFSLEDIEYALPVGRSARIFCLGLNYADHVKESRYSGDLPKWPSLFMRTSSSLVAHRQPLVRPRASETFDYEAELAFLVGRRIRHAEAAEALSCIAGYACSNEGSIREFQRHTTQWTAGKNFDRSGSLGPWFVTADELPPGATGLRIQTRLNGKTLQSDNTDNMIFDVVHIVQYLSKVLVLEPGDIVLTGTPSGVGHAQKPDPIWMRPGDTCEIEIEGIGLLENPIQDEEVLG